MGKKNKAATPTTRHQEKSATSTAAEEASSNTAATSSSSSNFSLLLFEFINLSLVLPTITTYTLVTIWNPTNFFGQLVCCFILDSVYCAAIGTIVKLILSKIIMNNIILISSSSSSSNYSKKTSSSSSSSVIDTLLHQSNDPSIIWPPKDAKLPQNWKSLAEEQNQHQQNDDKTPVFFLNHVRGKTRFVQAMLRLAHGCGTILMIYVMITYMNNSNSSNSYNTSEEEDHSHSSSSSLSSSPWSNIGLDMSSSSSSYNNNNKFTYYYLQDLIYGFVVGSIIIIVLFIIEVMLGWIHIIGYCEVVVGDGDDDDDDPNPKNKNKSLLVNLLWDILFHIGVSLNEELSLRGWILVHSSAFILSSSSSASASNSNSSNDDTDNTTTNLSLSFFSILLYHPMIMASIFQAIFFASLHAQSPGATYVGLFNLVIGGIVAAINVVLTGGLWFNLGWHFGWNIWMGHFLGLSTSGIPMSAKLISIVPHPTKSNLHGGRFGPEQSPLAPFAYLLGLIIVIYIYYYNNDDDDGTQFNGITIWNERLHKIY